MNTNILKRLMMQSREASLHDDTALLESDPGVIETDDLPAASAISQMMDSIDNEIHNKIPNKTPAKIWMAAVKFVTPAVCVSSGMSKSSLAAEKVASIILEQATISGYSSVLDAYSCGAPFDNVNIFGLYRYALSNAANCTSSLAFTHKKVIADFGSLLIAHLCESASGVKPISKRSVSGLDDCTQYNSARQSQLNTYLNATYPDALIEPQTKIKISVSKAIFASCAALQSKASRRIPENLLSKLVVSSITGQCQHWIERTKRSTNGDVITASDHDTSAMVVQNALKLITSLSSAVAESTFSGDFSLVLNPNAMASIAQNGRESIDLVLKKANAYATAFAQTGTQIFDAVQHSALPYKIVSPAAKMTASAWLQLFELPTKLSPFLTAQIASRDFDDSVDLAKSMDDIIYPAIDASTQLLSSLNVDSKWSLRPVCESAFSLYGHNQIRQVQGWSFNADSYRQVAESVLVYASKAGYGTLIDSGGAISVSDSLKVRVACHAMALDALLCAKKDSNSRFAVIEKILTHCIDDALKMFIKLDDGKTPDGQLMLFNTLFDGANLLMSESLRYEIRFNPSSTQEGIVSDLLSGAPVSVRMQHHQSAIMDKTITAIETSMKAIVSVAMPGALPKKTEAVLSTPVNQRAAMTL